MKKISFIFGTRPEAIKLCPLILAMRDHPDFEPHVCVTAQHREMLDQMLKFFEIEADVDLDLMRVNQSLASLTERAIKAIDNYLAEYSPDMVIVQGDTTTVFCASLTAFYHRIPVGHVEAGLRTHNKFSPFPEEINRVLTTHLADYHFAPTEGARNNLLREGIISERIFVTGNTVIDALHIAIDRIKKKQMIIPGLSTELMSNQCDRPLVLITGHRRENFGDGFINICNAIKEMAEQFSRTAFVYPVHLNPNVREIVNKILAGHRNIYLIDPVGYPEFVALMNRSQLILTDSGGVQEEGPSLGKPVLVMRDTTERPEAVDAGTVKLVGTDRRAIIENVSKLLTSKKAYNAMANATNPYGDGKASGRIIKACSRFLNKQERCE